MTSSLHQSLLAELADIERQQQNLDLSHSDQQLLDQAWEEVNNRLDELETIYEEDVEWRDAAAYLESESEDSRPASPPVTRSLAFHGVPPLSATWSPPPPIEIPQYTGPTGCPPPPRPGGVSICNCDSDGQCAYCEEEELERWNRMEDDRVGCRYCSGCMYCQDSRYDGADEV
jgi:hypothetical protein